MMCMMDSLRRGRKAADLWTVLLALFLSGYGMQMTCAMTTDAYDVVWDSPSQDYSGSMPIGNGDIGLNVWVEESGDLVFYIGKTDSWGDNARLLKVGKLRISSDVKSLLDTHHFQQRLNLAEGTIEIRYGKPDHSMKLMVWVDANHPVIHVSVEGQDAFSASAQIELWRTEPLKLPSIEIGDVYQDWAAADHQHAPTIVEPDTLLTDQKSRIGWYHHNKKSIGPAVSMRLQGLSDYPMVDPLLGRTFGAVVKTTNGTCVNDQVLKTKFGKSQRFDIYVLTSHPSTPQEWLKAVDMKIAEVESTSFEERRQSHVAWWRDFWDRSWIRAGSNADDQQDDAFIVTRGYVLQRFINACGGRGHYPIKFNGSIFNVANPGSPGDADYRRWGSGYWWQNTRLPYFSMCTSGDYDQMQALFRMYAEDVFNLSKYRTHHYFGYDGAYFPECVYFWGACFNEAYGWEPYESRDDKLQTSGYHKREWVCGPELVSIMLDYYEHTEDSAFLREKILPMAREIMRFFENYYKTGPNGKLLMHPAQALETWWECTNPMPEITGLRAMSGRLLALPRDVLTGDERSYWQSAYDKLPDIPTLEKEGVRMLAPAEEFARKENIENPELYAVFPFRLVTVGKPNVSLGLEALKCRGDIGNVGWRQDDLFMAYLGQTDQAREYLVGRAKKTHEGSRFPAFWGPNYDWIPDQDHGAVLMKTFQSMLIQTDGRKILLFPAWPKQWDVDFKLHAPYQTIIQGSIRNGKIEQLEVSPPERKQDIQLMGFKEHDLKVKNELSIRRYGSVIGVRNEKLDEYKALHAAVWTDVLAMIKECNIRNYSIYLRQMPDGNYYLFSYFEYTGNDFEADMARMAADPITQKWWDVCEPCQVPLPDRAEGEWWTSMEEVFHCD